MDELKLQLESVSQWFAIRHNLEHHALALLNALEPPPELIPNLQTRVAAVCRHHFSFFAHFFVVVDDDDVDVVIIICCCGGCFCYC